MDTLKKQSHTLHNGHDKKARIATKAHLATKAKKLLMEGKKLKKAVYKKGVKKVAAAEKNVKEYSDVFLTSVQEKPLTSVLIAAGIGFILTTIFKK